MRKEAKIRNVGLIAGVTGLVGSALAQTLLNAKWKVYGVSRAPHHALFLSPQTQPEQESMELIACDFTDREQTLHKLAPLKDITHLFWVTWAAHPTDDSMHSYIENRSMFLNAMDALLPAAKGLKHICLQTGTRHYGATFSSFPCSEHTPRVPDTYNFYYALEDVLFNAVKEKMPVLTWSVHRPGIILGQSARSLLNVVGSLGVYAAICKALQLPFVFPGSRACWEEPTIDFSDAMLVAAQQLWAATHLTAQNQAFNAINGDSGTCWKHLWPVLAHKFDLQMVDRIDESMSLAEVMSDKGPVWDDIVRNNCLYCSKMQDLADWWFLDSLFKFPLKLLASSDKCRERGFHDTKDTAACVAYWIDRMRESSLIP